MHQRKNNWIGKLGKLSLALCSYLFLNCCIHFKFVNILQNKFQKKKISIKKSKRSIKIGPISLTMLRIPIS
jgi:hypothetical protein